MRALERTRQPHRPRRWTSTLAGAAAAGVVLTGLLGACGSASSASTPNGGNGMTITGQGGPSQTNKRYPGAIVMPSAAAKPNVTLTDTSNQPYDLATATAGKVTLVYFGYTHCPDVCPINMALAGATVTRLPPKVRHQVTVVFITTDPHRDTPRVIRTWLDNFSGGHSFVGLTGSIAQIREAEKEVGMPLSFVEGSQTGDYQIEHAGYLLAYSQDNRAHLEFYDNEPAPNFAASLESLVAHGFQA